MIWHHGRRVTVFRSMRGSSAEWCDEKDAGVVIVCGDNRCRCIVELAGGTPSFCSIMVSRRGVSRENPTLTLANRMWRRSFIRLARRPGKGCDAERKQRGAYLDAPRAAGSLMNGTQQDACSLSAALFAARDMS